MSFVFLPIVPSMSIFGFPVSVPHLFPWIFINCSSSVSVLPDYIPFYLNPMFTVSYVRYCLSSCLPRVHFCFDY